jgi:ribonuclease BN (tRNA processing enzyme)
MTLNAFWGLFTSPSGLDQEKMKANVRITILGSGTCVPRLDRSSSAVLVEAGRAKILLDLGRGTMDRLLAYGVTIFDLTHICLSHFHPDHTSELVPLIFATKYPDRQARKHRLQVIGGPGLISFYQGLQAAYGNWIVLPDEQLQIRELHSPMNEPLRFNGFSLTANSMAHSPESLAYRIQVDDGISVVYSGDTDMCAALAELARGADLFICEASMPDARKVPGHLTPSLAGQIASKAKAKRLVLTHLYPPCDEVDIVKQARSTYKGPVIKAEDLMAFRF